MLRDEVELYTKLTGNDGWHTPIGIIGAYLDGYEKGLESRENIKGELISRQAVIDELEKWDWQELYLPIHFKQILDDVSSVENKEEWIPVSSGELPKIGQRVLATIETYDDGLKIVDTMYDKRGFMCGNALAWQPLPEPYKVERGEIK